MREDRGVRVGPARLNILTVYGFRGFFYADRVTPVAFGIALSIG
jgi:hypothetical protein